MSSQRRRVLSRILAVIFVVALLMGPGPGMLMINRPVSFLGIPLLYAWGLLWYVVEVGVVVVAYCFLWSRSDSSEAAGTPAERDAGERP